MSSQYYYQTLPAWVVAWNGLEIAESYRTQSWNLLEERATYWRRDRDDRPYEAVYKHFGRTMPKHFQAENDEAFYDGLKRSIANDELVLSFGKELIANEKLGQRGVADYLAIGFSSTDYVGHLWGPESLEAEDNLLRLDRILAELFRFLDEKVGLHRTIIVLSSDHGVMEIPEALAERGIAGRRIDPIAMKKALNTSLRKKYRTRKSYVKHFYWPLPLSR